MWGMVQQTIAIIGASGKMGKAITKSLAKAGYRLLLITSNVPALEQQLHGLCRHPSAEIEIMQCAYTASWEADIILLAVPYKAENGVAEKIKEVATNKIVISISNPVNETVTALETVSGKSAGEELQQTLPHSRVVKAFNTVYASDFEEPVIDNQPIDALLAGNNDEALQTVAALVKTSGFNPVIAGDIHTSSALENMQLMLMQLAQGI